MGQTLCTMGQTFSEFLPPKPKFNPARDLPDLSSKVIIVTGGNTGIGKETIKELLKKNAKVYMASRSATKAAEAIAELKTATGKEAIFLQLDLANLDSITASANEFKAKENALHVLFNSGGVMGPPIDQLTADGYDLQFGTNVLGHAHFTLCLIPELIEGARSSSDGKARVVNVSSDASYRAASPGVDFGALTDTTKRKALGSLGLYNQSKFGNVVFSNELARRYADQDIISNAVHPGAINTDLSRHMPAIAIWIAGMILWDVSYGALTQLYVGVSPETVNHNGSWFVPWARLGEPARLSKDPVLGQNLWDWIEEQRKGRY